MHAVTGARDLAGHRDICQPLILAGGALRGRIVRLSQTVDSIVSRHRFPAPVGELVADALISTVALASGLKYDGIFTFQVRGDGPVNTMVVDATSSGALRACASFDAGRLESALGGGRPGHLQPHLLGSGHLSFTVDQGPDTDRYQGVVELAGGALIDSVHQYFRQSEQLASLLKTAVSPPSPSEPRWRAAGVLIQQMPRLGSDFAADDADDLWRTAAAFVASVTDVELFDPMLTLERLAKRLFGTLECEIAPAREYRAECRCSRQRTGRILASFPLHELKSLAENGIVRMTCEFCRSDYAFTEAEVEALHAPPRITSVQE